MVDGVTWFARLWSKYELVYVYLDLSVASLALVSLEVDLSQKCSTKRGNYGAHWYWGVGKTTDAFWCDFASLCERRKIIAHVDPPVATYVAARVHSTNSARCGATTISAGSVVCATSSRSARPSRCCTTSCIRRDQLVRQPGSRPRCHLIRKDERCGFVVKTKQRAGSVGRARKSFV